MSSSSSAPNHAVIETILDDRVHVTLVYHLQHFSREWVDNSMNWPLSVIWFNDTEGDLECRIVKIGTKEECDNYAIIYEQTKLANQNESNHYLDDSTSLVGQFNSLKNEIEELKKIVYHHQNQIHEIHVGCTVQSKVYPVGSQKMEVPIRSISESLVLGMNSTGFMNLASRQLGDATFENKCWKEFDKDTQEQIQELLSFFVLNGLTLENGSPPKTSELSSKYKAIYNSFITLLNNRKYQKHKKRNNATMDNGNSSSVQQQSSTSKKLRTGQTENEDEVTDSTNHNETFTNSSGSSVEHSSDEPKISTIKFDDYESYSY